MEYLQEFPLVFFTLLVQMAVGMVLVGKCVLGNEADRALREGVRRQNVAALLLFAVAVIISFVHLGTPLHAQRQLHLHKLPRPQAALAVFKGGAQPDGSGARVYRIVHKGEKAFFRRAPGRSCGNRHRCLRHLFYNDRQMHLWHRKAHINGRKRVYADNNRGVSRFDHEAHP